MGSDYLPDQPMEDMEPMEPEEDFPEDIPSLGEIMAAQEEERLLSDLELMALAEEEEAYESNKRHSKGFQEEEPEPEEYPYDEPEEPDYDDPGYDFEPGEGFYPSEEE